ncbi:MAG: hypothetical protein GY801_24055 [bacterium]|nr:hypothetical protein [bacterium]
MLKRKGNMDINLYVHPEEFDDTHLKSFEEAYTKWNETSTELKSSMNELFEVLENT